ncbi:hypothetical protein SLA2020_195130 [Shorea laevis]
MYGQFKGTLCFGKDLKSSSLRDFQILSLTLEEEKHYIPFSCGRRACPGMSFALVEAEYMLANLLSWFDWKLPDGAAIEDFDMTECLTLVVHKKIPLHLVPVTPFPFSEG